VPELPCAYRVKPADNETRTVCDTMLLKDHSGRYTCTVFAGLGLCECVVERCTGEKRLFPVDHISELQLPAMKKKSWIRDAQNIQHRDTKRAITRAAASKRTRVLKNFSMGALNNNNNNNNNNNTQNCC